MSDTRPPHAPPNAPHWVVVKLSGDGDESAGEARKKWRRLYRHPTEALAIAECDRLASTLRGCRFAVYASGHTRKVDASAAADMEPGAIPPAGEDMP